MAGGRAEMSPGDLVDVVLRRKWLVVVGVAFAAATVVTLMTLQTPIYAATAEVLIEPPGEDQLFEARLGVDDRTVRTEVEVIEREAVRERVMLDLRLDELPPEADAEPVGDTDLVEIEVRDPNASNAAVYADAYAVAYIEERREQAVAQLLAATAEVQSAVEELQIEIGSLPEDDPRRTALIAQQVSFETLLDELRVDTALRTGGAAVVRTADVPDRPAEPTPWSTTLLAVTAGLLIGLAAVFIAEYLDDRIRTERDLRRVANRPVLAAVPVGAAADGGPLAVRDPTHPSLESYRGLRASLQFVVRDSTRKVIQVTSAAAGEGKTTVATNLAVILADAGHDVALVDADLRRPRVHVALDVSSRPGVTEILLGADPANVVRRVSLDGGHQLAVYPCGGAPPNPGAVLVRAQADGFFEDLAARHEYVIVDSPPVLPVSDATSLAGAVDGVLFVAQAGRIAGRDLVEALARLEQVGARVLGIVLNRAQQSKGSSYSYEDYAPRSLAPPRLSTDTDRKAGTDDTVTTHA